MEARIAVTGVVRVPLPVTQAFGLFTPSGETAWAQGWCPRFPAAVEEETDAGTVFETDHDGRRATWIVAASQPPHRIVYARVSEGDRAGTVSVECRPAGPATEVHVGYRLTALRDEARSDLAGFAAHYDGFLAHWEQAIARHLGPTS